MNTLIQGAIVRLVGTPMDREFARHRKLLRPQVPVHKRLVRWVIKRQDPLFAVAFGLGLAAYFTR